MGVVRCGMHGRQSPKCCWRCDKCPSCNPEMGRLLRGDYCKACTAKFKAAGYVFSVYCMDWVTPAEAATIERNSQPAQPVQENLFGGGQ